MQTQVRRLLWQLNRAISPLFDAMKFASRWHEVWTNYYNKGNCVLVDQLILNIENNMKIISNKVVHLKIKIHPDVALAKSSKFWDLFFINNTYNMDVVRVNIRGIICFQPPVDLQLFGIPGFR